MKLADFQYDLPASAIAQEPISPRDASRLMVLKRGTSRIAHRQFQNILEELRAGDVLVMNETKVFPARLRGKKKSGGKIELLLMEPLDDGWKALVRGTTKPAPLEFPGGLRAEMAERLDQGEWRIQFSGNHLREYLEQYGEMPLPPYIKRPQPRASDLSRYQTVYAKEEGAVAAPTAGFHFTESLLAALQKKGVLMERIVLHVGWGTFRPIRTENVQDHPMLPEFYEVNDKTSQALNRARAEKRRVIAVGTTVVRTLESVYDRAGHYHAGRGKTNLFIYPGYVFKGVDALVTNFHLPDSTPLLLACAFFTNNVHASEPFSLRFAYHDAIREGYRFYSYGDAMFIQ